MKWDYLWAMTYSMIYPGAWMLLFLWAAMSCSPAFWPIWFIFVLDIVAQLKLFWRCVDLFEDGRYGKFYAIYLDHCASRCAREAMRSAMWYRAPHLLNEPLSDHKWYHLLPDGLVGSVIDPSWWASLIRRVLR